MGMTHLAKRLIYQVLTMSLRVLLFRSRWIFGLIGIAGTLLAWFYWATPYLNAQEISPNDELVGEQPEVVEVVPTTEDIQTPVEEAGVTVPIVDWWDTNRLDVKVLQDISYENTGEYAQVTLDENILSGDKVVVQSIKTSFDGRQEVHVYEAPCGKGWVLIVRDFSILVESTQQDEKGNQFTAYVPTIRSYGYGCEHVIRTVNW